MKKFIAIICSALIITLVAVGCAKGVASNESQNEESLTGTISLAGSTSMEKLCEAMSESFMADNQGITVTVEYVGSGAGIEALSKGSVDIGNSSRNLKPEELSNGCVENVVALDGIAVIVDKNNGVTDISSDDLKKLYTGEIKNWKELGGADEAVVVIGREAGSGTRDAFEELLELKDKCDYAQQLDSTGAVLAKVASTPGAIGYVSLDVVDESVLSVSIDSVEANEQNILAGKYLLSRPFVMATKGDVSSQNELVQKWFEYVNSEKGKEIIKKVGLIVPVQE
ncbi:phosphate ABC transporter substrate-binding protein [uncultured Eubacterium sp.]|uniref:phosphate ABC transporter substrate-binding protein n=1 Tax=uncultured Eubacterium sp. TaxID=165185 RepID=UPI0025ED1144|nr:phosphate ABC transporter substrate-binding protein [uncultured Eubacterium sp.]